MILPEPNEKLHIYIAVLGLTIAAFGIWQPMKMYNEAQMARIEASAVMLQHNHAVRRYAAEVNRRGSALDVEVPYESKADFIENKESVLKAFDKFFASQDKVDDLEREFLSIDSDLVRKLKTMDHRIFLFYVWSVMGAALVLAGSILSFFGFRRWIIETQTDSN